MKINLFLLFFFFSPFFCYSQNISGSILDNKTKSPLFYVNTGLINAVDSSVVASTFTNKEGSFQFANLKSGSYILRTSYIGYETYEQTISVLDENSEIKLDTIFLKPIATELQTVSVTTTKPIYMDDGEKTLYNVSEDASIQTGTAADALQNAPGVEVDIEGNITLRGVSSVEIWINNRPSRLAAENLKTYIQQLPANALERIEVITNPSARYSASGTGGIINIVTKSNVKKNSFFSFGLNGSTKPMASPWFSYMFSNEKFAINVYANGYYYFGRSKGNGYSTIFNENKDTASNESYTNKDKYDGLSSNIYLNGSYNIDSLKTISFYGGVYSNFLSRDVTKTDFKYQEFINNPGIYDYTEEQISSQPNLGGWFGVEYEHNFNDDGHKIVTAIDASIYKMKYNYDYQRFYTNYPALNKDKRFRQLSGNYGVNGEINYTLPYHENGELEIGVEGDYTVEQERNRNDTLYRFSGVYMLDSMRFLNYKSQLSDIEAYITVQHKFGGFTIKGGLRSENSFLKYDVINQPQHNGKKFYAGLFPSLHLSYSTKKKHNFKISYTRRVQYPESSQLITYISYGEANYSTGNPDLNPCFTNSVEAGWTKYFDKFGSVGINAYFKNNKDEINNFSDVVYDDFFGRYVTYYMPVNSGKSHRYGGDVNVNYKLKSFFNVRLNVNLYQYHGETIFREDEKAITDCFTYSFRLMIWAKMWKVLEINASGNYRSKTKTIFTETLPNYSINLGLRADFWERKISVFLNANDIFNWGRYGSNVTNPYYIAYSSTKYNSRSVAVGITFRFGKIELEHRAKSGSNTE